MEINNNNNNNSKNKRKKNKKKANNTTTTTTTTNNDNNNNKANNNNNNNNPKANSGSTQKKTKNSKNSKRGFGRICQALGWCGASAACFYTVVPFLFWYFPEMCTFMIFSNRFRWPPVGNLDKPFNFGLNHTRNLYLNPRRNIQIGVWHVLPQTLADSKTFTSDLEYDQSFSEQNLPVVLYMHGNTGTRAGSHRVQMYKIFSAMNYHTITFDYRGFAESTGIPSEDGVVEDGQFLFNWIKQRVNQGTPIILWGHSLGTGVATKLAKNLCDQGSPPTALVLEAPFTNIVNATYYHPFLIPFNYFKSLKLKLTNVVRRSGVEFASDESISSVTSPVIILHAEDDFLIPIELGKKLYKIGVETRPKQSGPIKIVTFKKSLGYGHKHIHKAPELPEIILTIEMRLGYLCYLGYLDCCPHLYEKKVPEFNKKVPEFEKKVPKFYKKHLKKVRGHIGRNVVNITIKMRTTVRIT